jgi:hypothetical protein
MEPYRLPRRYHNFFKLPPHLESIPSKRRKIIKHGTNTSTYQTCDHTSMSTESIHKDIGSPSNSIPFVVNGNPSMPSTTVVVVPEVPVITYIRPAVATQPIVMNPFGSLFGTPGYNAQSIPSVSNPFSFGMPNMTSQLSSSIILNNTNPIIGLGGMAPLHIPLLFGGAHIPQMNPMVGSQPPFPPRSNLSLNSPRCSNQPGEQTTTYVSSFTPSSSTPIPTNTFCMMNPPLSSIFPPRGSQFHTMGNSQHEALLARGNVYNPHYNIPTGMVPMQPLMN